MEIVQGVVNPKDVDFDVLRLTRGNSNLAVWKFLNNINTLQDNEMNDMVGL